MTRKEKILRAIEEMPDEVSIDNAIGKIDSSRKRRGRRNVLPKRFASKIEVPLQLRTHRGKLHWEGDLDSMRRD